jgi:hypothetical protein
MLGDAPVEGADLGERARALVRELGALRPRRHSAGDEDVRDPIGHPPEVHLEAGEAIADALLPPLRRLAELVPAEG